MANHIATTISSAPWWLLTPDHSENPLFENTQEWGFGLCCSWLFVSLFALSAASTFVPASRTFYIFLIQFFINNAHTHDSSSLCVESAVCGICFCTHKSLISMPQCSLSCGCVGVRRISTVEPPPLHYPQPSPQTDALAPPSVI